MNLWQHLYVEILLCWKDSGKESLKWNHGIVLSVCVPNNAVYSNNLQSNTLHCRILNLYLMFVLMEGDVKWTGDSSVLYPDPVSKEEK